MYKVLAYAPGSVLIKKGRRGDNEKEDWERNDNQKSSTKRM
jgi:hypothetical protein